MTHRNRLIALAGAAMLAATAVSPSVSAATAADADVLQARLNAEIAKIEMPPGRWFPPGTPAAELKQAMVRDNETLRQQFAAAYLRATGTTVTIPDQSAAFAAMVDGDPPAATATDAGDDPIADAIEGHFGQGETDETSFTPIAEVGSCAGYGTMKKRKIPFSNLYAWVSVSMDYLCTTNVIECGLSGVVFPASFSLVTGRRNLGDTSTNRCLVESSRAYIVARPCAGFGWSYTITRHDGTYQGPWAVFC